ncbi:MAG: regulatory iron-sulfur-containing complex subunit RicT [Sediminibacterium sp.]
MNLRYMGCGSCGTGKPGGCKSNGGCSTGGCNRLNVHDWLNDLPIDDINSQCKVVEVSFNQGSRKEFFRNPSNQLFEKGDYVTVEGVNGFDLGEVSLTGELVRLQLKKRGIDESSVEIKKILRPSNERDIEAYQISKSREADILAKSRAHARHLRLQMKLSEVEIQADGKKGTFFYTADDRIDFRELIRIFASEFKVKVEMRQIGIRQEAAKVGGIGSCGRELCCSTWLHDFKSVNTTAARYQNLSINQTKLSGQCGRLKCCLNFELDTYLDALQSFPDYADNLQTVMGQAFLIKKDIFKNLMWYTLPNNTKHYPLTIERVKEIKKLNQQGIAVEELQAVEVTSAKPKEVEPDFVDVVGQISLRSLEKNDRRRRDQQRFSNNDRRSNNNDRTNNGPNRPGGQQGNSGGARPMNNNRPPMNRPNKGPRSNNRPNNRPPQGSQPSQGRTTT